MSAGSPPIKSRDWNEALRSFLATRTRRDADRRFDWLHTEFLSDTVQRVLTDELRRGAFTSQEEAYEYHEIFIDLSLLVRGKIFGLLLKLWQDRQDDASISKISNDKISNFYSYVVTVTKNVCVDYLRRKYPGRHALDNALRVSLEVRPDLALWRVPIDNVTQEWRCGRQEWQKAGRFPITLQPTEDLAVHLKKELVDLDRSAALARVFEIAQAPLRYTQLLNFLVEYWDVEAVHRNALRGHVDFRVPKPYVRGIQPEEVVDLMGRLQGIWGQIKHLTPIQAAVMLLKVPEYQEGSFLDEMVRLRVAAWDDIAQITRLPMDLLLKLSTSVPLSDHEIGDALNIPTEDVPRIRQDARRRLERLRNVPSEK